MAVQLKHSVFVHIPKAGGRWARETLLRVVDGARQIDDPVYDAHYAPRTDLPVISMIRDPVDWMESLYAHRAHKRFNWHIGLVRGKYEPNGLELECHHRDAEIFFQNIVDRPGIITNGYVMHWLGKYKDVRYVRLERAAEDFLRVLDELGEKSKEADCPDFSCDAVKTLMNRLVGKKIGSRGYVKKCPPHVARQIRENEWDFFGQFYGDLPE